MKSILTILLLCISWLNYSWASTSAINSDIVIVFNSRNCHNCIIYDAQLIKNYSYVNYTLVARKTDSAYMKRIVKAFKLKSPLLFNDSIFKAVNIKEAPETYVAYKGEGNIWVPQTLHKFYSKDFPEKFTLPMILNKKVGRKISTLTIDELFSFKGASNKHIWFLGHNPSYITKIDLNTLEKTVIEKPVSDEYYLPFLKEFLGEKKAEEVYANRPDLDSIAFDYFKVNNLLIINDDELILEIYMYYSDLSDSLKGIKPQAGIFKYNVNNKSVSLISKKIDTLGLKGHRLLSSDEPRNTLVFSLMDKQYKYMEKNPMFIILKQENGVWKKEVSKAKHLKINELFTSNGIIYSNEVLAGNFCFYKKLNQFVNIHTGEWFKLPFKQKNGKKEIQGKNPHKHYINSAMVIGDDVFLTYTIGKKKYASIISSEGKVLVNKELTENDFKSFHPITIKYGISRNEANAEEFILNELE